MRVLPIDDEGLRLVEEWMAQDPVGSAIFGGFYGRATQRWAALLQTPDRHGWITSDEEGPIGFIDLEILDGEAEVTYYVCPDRRGAGLGRATAKELVRLAADCGAGQVHAAVDSADVASVRSLRSAGFSEVGQNEFDELELVLELPRSA